MYPNITRRTQALGAAVLMGLLLGLGCAGGGSSNDLAPASSAGPDGDAGTHPPTVDPSCTPKAGADLPDDNFEDANCDGVDGDKSHAIFVAPTGSDTASGSVESPVRTLVKAVTLASAAKKDVYVCNGSYAESVVVANVAVGIYGGYDCANGWARGNDRATIAPTSGIPLTIRDVTTMTVDRIALHAADAVDPSASSIGAFVSNAHDVQLAHVTATAGRGADGETPATPASLAQTASSGSPGRSLAAATCTRNDPNLPSACSAHGAGGFAIAPPPACEGAGGAGGDGGNVLLGIPNAVGVPGAPLGVGGVNHGANGGDGLPGSIGVAGSIGVGTITAAGYVASNKGADGSDGASGGGGAGGIGGLSQYLDSTSTSFNAGGGGGQGGNGGCGGVAAKGAGAGGASVGVLLFSSDVKLRNSSIHTSAGGKGGRSVAGARGQFGGYGGNGGNGTHGGRWGNDGDAEKGGNGGNGGNGGTGGAGAGGPSVGILSNDRAPALTAVTFVTDSGGKGGSGVAHTDGADGVARDVFVLNESDAGPRDSGSSD